MPSVRIPSSGWGDRSTLQLGAARLRPGRRGAAAQSAGRGRATRTARSIAATTLQQRVCFDGTVDLLGGSLQWEPDSGDWRLAVAALARRERGSLYSSSGDAMVKTRVTGGWADVAWRPTQRWTLAARLERLVPDNHLEGVGTQLLARESGLSGGAVDRATLAVLFEPLQDVQLAIEGGQERFAGGRVSHLALRALWRNPRWLGGAW